MNKEHKDDWNNAFPEGRIEEKTAILLSVETKSVTIDQKLLQEITDYSKDAIPNEAIGLLGGKEIRDKELLVTKVVHVTVGSEYDVSFSDDDFQVFEKMTDSEYCIGWWHSHPGFGLFLSKTDIQTQIFSFQITHELSVALVVDPKDIDTDGLAKYKFFQAIADSRKNFFHYKEVASYKQV
jgi:26S proteasome regulatory subunit N11